MAPTIIHLPEMALTLVRRASSKLPYNHFMFRTDTKWTKAEIREYLEKVYSVKVARIATAISLGTCSISSAYCASNIMEGQMVIQSELSLPVSIGRI